MEKSIKQTLLRHNQNLPRYTSYPPANFFTPAYTPETYAAHLASLPPGPVSLYLHIPFCPKMCWFCGCHTQATARYDPIPHYLDLLRQEINLVAARLPSGVNVAHIHFGGGSPTMLSSDDFSALIDHLSTQFHFNNDIQIAVEIDPRQITPDKIKAYQKSNVTRVSLGVQDINDKVMQAINRVQPFDVTARAVALCRAHGMNDINIDLVYGLPHQTVNTMRDTVDAVATLSPNRLALFGYAHVPWMKKHMRLIVEDDLPTSDARYDLFETASYRLMDHGYTTIGIDHFARPDDPLTQSLHAGDLKRNFQGYVPAAEDLPIIGLGVSSISQTPFGYAQNTPHMPHYRDALASNTLPTARGHIMTPDDLCRRDIIERLMCDGVVDIPKIMAQHPGVSLDPSTLAENLAPLITDGLATGDMNGTITATNRLSIRMIAAAFDAYRAPQQTDATPPRRHATAI